jgi:hypothetical protein
MRRSTFVISVAILGVVLFAWGPWNAGADVTSANKIEGTWLTTINTGGPAPVQFLQTIGTGNTFTSTSGLFHAHTATGPLAAFFPFNFSDLHGTWEKERGNTFTVTLLALVFDPITREHVGFIRVRGTTVVEGDTLTGEAINELILGPPALPDPDTGTVVFTGLATFVGRRISVD